VRVFKRGRVWYAQFYDRAGERQTRSTKCHDRAAAEQVARRLERESADPNHTTSTTTLESALDDMIAECWAQAKEGKLSTATVDFYTARAGHLVRALQTKDAEGELVLPTLASDLAARHVDGYIALRRDEGVTANTISKELVVLRKTLRLAKPRGRWDGDLAKIMPIGFSPGYQPRQRWLVREEFDQLLVELGRDRGAKWPWHNMVAADRAARVAFIVATSARLGESDRAERVDIDLDAGFVRVRGTKTDASERWVPIVTTWQRELLKHALAGAANKDAGRLFRPWVKNVRDLRDACGRASIEPCSANDLRRTYSHWMRAAGMPVELIGPSMGHVDTRMVETTYGRFSREELAARMLRAVAPVYQEPRKRENSPQDFGVLVPTPRSEFCVIFGSSCWTRTSDPVINSPPAGGRNCSRFGADCTAGEQEQRRPGLAKGGFDVARMRADVDHLSDLWDMNELAVESC